MRRSPPRHFRGRLPRAIGMDGRCNGGTRDLIQINESMPITLSIVLAAIERRLKCQQRFLGRNASFAHGRLSSAEASDVVADDGSSGEAPDLPRHSYDVSLLCVLDLAQERDEPGNQGWRPQCHDAERSRRRAKLRAGGAIPADARSTGYLANE